MSVIVPMTDNRAPLGCPHCEWVWPDRHVILCGRHAAQARPEMATARDYELCAEASLTRDPAIMPASQTF